MISPRAVGAGPIVFIVTNQASKAESMAITRLGTSAPPITTGPINPQGTAQVTVNTTPGLYAVASSQAGGTEAAEAAAATRSIRPALLQIGPPRPSGSNQLLQP